MPDALVLLAPGVEEIEAVTVIDVLRRAEIEVTAAGTEPGVLLASRGVRIEPDLELAELPADRRWDVVVLPGGMRGTLALQADVRVRERVAAHAADDRWIAAICAAPMVLADLGLLDGRRATCHPGVRDEVGAGELVDERVVIDGRIVTSQGPGTAMEFALTLIELLCGPDAAVQVNAGLLSSWTPGH